MCDDAVDNDVDVNAVIGLYLLLSVDRTYRIVDDNNNRVQLRRQRGDSGVAV